MTFLLFPIRFCATVGIADVTSANVVGYESDALTGGKSNMNGVMFTGVDGEDLDLNKDFTFANLTGGVDETESDTINIWDPATSGYTTYFYYNEEGCEGDWGWWDTDWSGNSKLPAGTAFWYRAKVGNNKGMTIAGAVEGDADITFDITPNKSNMIANPYPSAFSLNDATTVEFINFTGGVDETESDTVNVWDPATSGYTTYFYYNEEGCEGDWGWWDTDWSGNDTIGSGVGFWYRAKPGENKKITFKSPIVK